jgi:tetratricopeptide (TPR) repeat protein
MKRKITILVGIILFFFPYLSAHSEDISSFNGLTLGDDKSSFISKLGEPNQKQQHGDTEVYIYYSMDKTGYFVVGVDNENKIYKLQSTGDKPFNNEDLKGVELGDSENKLFKTFGEPSESKYQDEKWGTSHKYDDCNYSFETNKGKVISIYIIITPYLRFEKYLNEELTKPKYKTLDDKVHFLFSTAMFFKNDKDDCSTAVKIFDLALSYDADNFPAIVNQANCFLDSGQNEKARLQYMKAEKKLPDDPILLHNIGLANYRLKEYNTAKEYFKKSISISENNSERNQILLESLEQLGNLYDDTGNKDMAIKTYEKGLSYDKNNTSILCEMAVAYKDSDDTAKARELLNKVLSIDSNNERAKEILEMLGAKQLDSEGIEAAKTTFKINCDNRHNDSCYRLAILEYVSGNTDEAKAIFNKLCEHNVKRGCAGLKTFKERKELKEFSKDGFTLKFAQNEIEKLIYKFKGIQEYRIFDIKGPIDNLIIVAIDPPYREFPNILLFKKYNDKWSIVFETLSIGLDFFPSGLLDTHTVGHGVDFLIEKDDKNINQISGNNKSKTPIIHMANNEKMIIISYGKFYHMHPSTENSYFIDKTNYIDFANKIFGEQFSKYPQDTCIMFDNTFLTQVVFKKNGDSFLIEANTINGQAWKITFSGIDSDNRFLKDKKISVIKSYQIN